MRGSHEHGRLPPALGSGPDRAQPVAHQLGHGGLHGGDPRPGPLGPAAPLLESPGAGGVAGALLAHRLHRRHPGLSPPAGPPLLSGGALVGALDCHLWHPQLSAWADRLGRPASPPPPPLRRSQRPPQQPPGPVVEPFRLDAQGGARQSPCQTPDPRSAGQCLLPLAESQLPVAAIPPGGLSVVAWRNHRRRRPGPGALGHPVAAGGGLSLHLDGEFGHPPLGLRQPRKPRPIEEQLVGGPAHLR